MVLVMYWAGKPPPTSRYWMGTLASASTWPQISSALRVGAGHQALRADMEAEADLGAARMGLLQQGGGLRRLGPELGGEVEEDASTGGVVTRTTMVMPSAPVSFSTLSSSSLWSTTKVSTP